MSKRGVFICGFGKTGKDEFGRMLVESLGAVGWPTKHCPTSWYARDYVFNQWGASVTDSNGDKVWSDAEACWNSRRAYRSHWSTMVAEYNRINSDGERLYREAIRDGCGVITGIRQYHELKACQDAELVAGVVWLRRTGDCRMGETGMTIQERHADLTIVNYEGDLPLLRRRALHLAVLYGRLIHGDSKP